MPSAKSILRLSAKQARAFFQKPESYSGIPYQETGNCWRSYSRSYCQPEETATGKTAVASTYGSAGAAPNKHAPVGVRHRVGKSLAGVGG